MGNLFIGFPVPRARIADMIAGAAPPLNHVANHRPAGSDPIVLPGDISTSQVLQWNGSKFVGAGLGLIPPLVHKTSHLPAGSDPIVLSGDISTGQIVLWNGTKYVGSAAPSNGGYPSPISVNASAFSPTDDDVDYCFNGSYLTKRNSTTGGTFYGPVFLPHGATVTKMTLFAFCQVGTSHVHLSMYRKAHSGAASDMAAVVSNWTDGAGSIYDDSIANGLIDNSAYSYGFKCVIEPQDQVNNAGLYCGMIDFT